MKEKSELEQIPLVIITPEEKPASNFTIKQFIGTKRMEPEVTHLNKEGRDKLLSHMEACGIFPIHDPGAMYTTKDPEIAAREALWWVNGHVKEVK